MKHDWFRHEDGSVDIFRFEEGHHNGPGCRRCGGLWCHHCDRSVYEEECPSSQLDLPLEDVVE